MRVRNCLFGLGCVLGVVFGLSACQQDQRATTYKTTEYVFGTLVDITIRGVSEAKAKAAVADLSAGFRTMHEQWHAWKVFGDKPGDVMAINRACQSGQPVVISDQTVAVLHQAKVFETSSQGLFNPAMGNIIGAWGFHNDELPKGHKPPFAKIASWLARKPSMQNVHVAGHTVTCSNPAVSLDFGGFAKGSALDWALAQFKAKGISNAVINAGGDVSTLGQAIDGDTERPWRIGIRHPRHWGVLASVEAKPGEAIYTSGNYERYNDHDGLRHSHIIDPRNGQAVQTIVSATVVHASGALADAAATALSVAGPDDWPKIAKAMGTELVLLVDENGGMYASQAMADRLIFDKGKMPDIRVHKF